MDALQLLNQSKQRVERFFDLYFNSIGAWQNDETSLFLRSNPRVVQAMRYSLDAGGKRLRPALIYGVLETLSRDWARGDMAASALEMVHTYSLIHDDLPCMDDDDLRRGRPTCHVRFGEAHAVLAGDGLLTEAFSVLSHDRTLAAWGPVTAMAVIRELSIGAGVVGMVGGQALDLESEGKSSQLQELEGIHRKKTGALIRAGVRMGAWVGQATSAEMKRLTQYGDYLGLAFQVADDVLDVTATSEALGKTAGKDIKSQKTTYPGVMGLQRAQEYASVLADQAVETLKPFGDRAECLRSLARFTVNRGH